jgi:hypothetical protein
MHMDGAGVWDGNVHLISHCEDGVDVDVDINVEIPDLL